jgi:hypothetical protein
MPYGLEAGSGKSQEDFRFQIVDFRFYNRVIASSSSEKSAICILKPAMSGLHHSS